MDVLVTEDVWGEPLRALGERWQVVREPDLWQDPERFLRLAADARALVVRNRSAVDAGVFAAAAALRIVARAGVGLDNIDVTAADRAGVVVAAPLGANAVSVAEHTIGLALALARGTVGHDGAVRSGGWSRAQGRELSGGTWGLLGAGATARACGRLAAALGMRVLAYDPYLPADHPELGDIELAPLEDVAAAADVLSCHLPATAEATGVVDAKLLSHLGSHALFVNVGRGEVVDEDALADALERGAIAGAALDVRATEPPVPGRLDRAPNTVFTPHVAGITTQSQHRILQVLADDIDAVLRGNPASAAVGKVKV